MKYWRETGIIGLFIFTRFIYLKNIPIFNDESTYIRYGLHHVLEPSHQFYSLLIGKEPLMPYLFAQFGLISPDLLLGARLVSILAGFLTLLGIFYTTKLIAGKNPAYFASLFYVLSPYNLFFDRLALLDSAISTVVVWALYFTIKIIKVPKWYHAALLGTVVGLGLWIKTSALFTLFLPQITFALCFRKDTKGAGRKLKFAFSAFGISLVIFSLLYFQPYYAVHKELLKQYTYPLTSIFHPNFQLYVDNFTKIIAYMFFYLTPPLFLLSLASFKIRKDRMVQILFLWVMLPLLYMTLFAKLLTARQSLILSVPILILAGIALEKIATNKLFRYGILAFICFWCMIVNITLLFYPQKFPEMFFGPARVDMTQYTSGFASGYGVEESIMYLKDKTKEGKITIVIRNDTGNPEDAIVAYLYYDPKVEVIPLNNTPSIEELEKLPQPAYFVSRGGQYLGLEKYLRQEKVFRKPNDSEFVGIYRLDLTNPQLTK